MRFSLASLALVAVAAFAGDFYPRGSGTRVQCHRTANRDVPENTLASLEAAARLGCEIVEIDVARTLDGELVLLHDGPIDRISSGSGEVEQLTYAELRLYDAGAWMNPRFAGLRAPRLVDALRRARDLRLKLILDLKSAGITQQVLALARREQMEDQVRFGGLAEAMPAPRIMIWQPGQTRAAVEQLQREGIVVVANFSANDQELDLAGMRAAVAAGVDVLNTDHPLLASAAVGRPVAEKVGQLRAAARAGDLTAIAELPLYLDFDSAPLLSDLAADPRPAVSRAAAAALVEMKRVDLLRPLLNQPGAATLANAAWALGMLADRPSGGRLLGLVAHADPAVRREAMLALARLGTPVPRPILIPRLTDPDPLMAGYAAMAAARGRDRKAAHFVKLAAESLRQRIAVFQREKLDPVRGQRPAPELLAETLALYRGYQKVTAAMTLLPDRELLWEEAQRAARDMTSISAWTAAYQLWDAPPGEAARWIPLLAHADAGVRARALWSLFKTPGIRHDHEIFRLRLPPL